MGSLEQENVQELAFFQVKTHFLFFTKCQTSEKFHSHFHYLVPDRFRADRLHYRLQRVLPVSGSALVGH